MKTNPIEPAFPRDERYHGHNGLTKREHFAAMAMQGTLAGDPNQLISFDFIAKQAIKAADALIAELNKEGGSNEI